MRLQTAHSLGTLQKKISLVRWGWLGLLLVALTCSVIVATSLGAVPIPIGEAAKVLAQRGLGLPLATDAQADAIIWSVRAPRVMVAGFVGFALGISGAAMQGFFRNPLASPDITGVTTGGSMGAVLALFWQGQFLNVWLVPLASFGGAVLAVTLVYTLATRAGKTDAATVLLAGVALSSLFGGVISTLFHFTEDGVLRQIVYWLMGNLTGKRWEHVLVIAPFVLGASLGLWGYARELNVMSFGEDQARAMGVAVEKVKRVLLVLVALNAGAAVSVSGAIGFVGLIIPHMMRILIGPDHRWLLPASALGGAAFLIICDLLARLLFAPIELRTGIVTAFFGVPFFLYLLLKKREIVRWT